MKGDRTHLLFPWQFSAHLGKGGEYQVEDQETGAYKEDGEVVGHG